MSVHKWTLEAARTVVSRYQMRKPVAAASTNKSSPAKVHKACKKDYHHYTLLDKNLWKTWELSCESKMTCEKNCDFLEQSSTKSLNLWKNLWKLETCEKPCEFFGAKFKENCEPVKKPVKFEILWKNLWFFLEQSLTNIANLWKNLWKLKPCKKNCELFATKYYENTEPVKKPVKIETLWKKLWIIL